MTKNKIGIIVFSLFFLILSCTEKKQIKSEVAQTYQKEGISFELPGGWKVKQDFFKEGVRYLELDKYSNYKVESTMAISIYSKEISSDSILKEQIKQLQFFYQKVNFKILDEKKNSQLGKYAILATTYEADDTKNKVFGQVGIIQNKQQTISVQIVENKPNTDVSDYNTMFNTFTIN